MDLQAFPIIGNKNQCQYYISQHLNSAVVQQLKQTRKVIDASAEQMKYDAVLCLISSCIVLCSLIGKLLCLYASQPYHLD